jgi:sugar phosphate permease
MSNSALPITTAAVDFESPEDADLRAQVSKRVTVFSLTWIAYAAYYFGRMGFPVVKSTLQKTLGLTVGQLGWIDTGYLTAYAIGQFGSGFLGDRIGPRRLIGLGMLGVAIACTAFGLSSAAMVLFTAYILNGMFQSTGWPGTCKAMGSWLTPRERGTVMGLWSTCYQIGPILATWTATFLFAHWGWRWAFLGPAIIITIVGLMNLFFLPERAAEAPRAQGPDAADPAVEASDSDFSILRTPVLWSLGAAYFCLKLIRYSIFFWLPYYLNQVLHYPADVAGYRSVSFTVGGVVGSVVVGLISDRYFPGRRRVISAIMCAALAGALVLYIQVAPISMTINFVSMALIGFCLFGPDTIICGAAAQDIGGRHNVAKAAGFINGVGSIGAIFQGVVTAKISTSRFGWNGLFYFFVLLALLSSIALLIGKRPAPAATKR